jgi:hypothetical protein
MPGLHELGNILGLSILAQFPQRLRNRLLFVDSQGWFAHFSLPQNLKVYKKALGFMVAFASRVATLQ